MRIKKTSQYMEGGASISNVYGTSQSDGYSQEYINGIIESGSGTYFNYIKYANGTLIQYGTISLTPTFGTWGSLYSADVDMTSYTFPVSFVSKPVITANGTGGASGGNVWVARVGLPAGDTSGNTSPGTITVVRPTTWSGAVFLNITAIGKWK